MRKIKNNPKDLNKDTKYDLSYTRTNGQKLPKSFWQKLTKKGKLSLIGLIATVTIATPTLSNFINECYYPNISGYEICMENIENNDTLDYWLNEYNNAADNGAKKYIMTQIAGFSNQIETEALDGLKDMLVEQIKENPKDDDYFYSKIEDSSDIKIKYSVDSYANRAISVVDNYGNSIDVDMSDSMKDVIESIGDLQEISNSNDSVNTGRQVLKVINKLSDLEGYERQNPNIEIQNDNNDRDDR